MKNTVTKNIKLIIVFTLMIAAFGAVYFGISKHHFSGAAASAKQTDKTSCTESRAEESMPSQFVAFRIMQLL